MVLLNLKISRLLCVSTLSHHMKKCLTEFLNIMFFKAQRNEKSL